MLHDEVHGVAALAAGEAFAQAFGGGYHERGRAVVVERAQALVVDASLAQRDEVRDDIDNLRRFQYPVHRSSVDHPLSLL